MRKILLLGGAGQLGTEIRQCWKASITAPSHHDLDIANRDHVRRTLEADNYDLVVNCAAFHNVDACEREPERAFLTNAIAVDHLAAACSESGAVFVTISTDYVFDGSSTRPYTEVDCPRPIQAYGASKLAGEHLCRRSASRHFAIRTCGIYGVRTSTTKGYTFIDRVLSQVQAGERATVVSDVVASPTYARHLAEALWRLVQTEEYGLYHAVNTGAVTWYEYASEALRQAEIDGSIEPISSSHWKSTAPRPKYSALANERLESVGIAMPDWRAGVADYLRDKAAADTST